MDEVQEEEEEEFIPEGTGDVDDDDFIEEDIETKKPIKPVQPIKPKKPLKKEKRF